MAQNSMDSDRLSSAGISTHSSGTAGTVGGSVVGVRVGDPSLKREDEDEYNLGPLPPMWEKSFTPTGETYFIDHNTGTSHWLDPRLARVRKHSLGECGEDELPYGWERVTDERYGSYYVDHINRRTQYENPVLQARRLRAEKLTSVENGGDSSTAPTGELRGERFTVTLTKGTQGLGFTLIGAEGIPETEGYLQIRSIVPNSPAWIDGALRPGDVVARVGRRGVRGLPHALVARLFQAIPPGAGVELHCVRGYPLPFDSEDPHTRVLSTLAVDASGAGDPRDPRDPHDPHDPRDPRVPHDPADPPAALDAVAMHQLTRALRTRFNLDGPESSPGRDETDASPVAPPSPTQRRLMSRSFDLDELATNSEQNNVPPRCPSADHLLSLATTEHQSRRSATEGGTELVLRLRRGHAGFGFTIADSVHGQKVKKVLDRGRCGGLREGDLLLQIGDRDVARAPHHLVVQALKECPAARETAVRVWRRVAPRSRSACRTLDPTHATAVTLSRSKTPTAEQLRSPTLAHETVNGMDTEATYAVPDHKRESLIDRRRRNSTPGGRPPLPLAAWAGQGEAQGERGEGEWGEPATPTLRIDVEHAYWRGSASQADSSDNGGFHEDGMQHSPATVAMRHRQSPSTRTRPHSPSHSNGELRGHSGSPHSLLSAALQGPDREPHRMREGSPLGRRLRSPYYEQDAPYGNNYPQVEAGHPVDPLADVVVRLARGAGGFGFRIVGGTEDGTRLAVGHVVPGGPAHGLLRAGDLLTSVDGVALAGSAHASAVRAVCAAAARGHVTLGVRHNRADIQPLGIPAAPRAHPAAVDPSMHHMQQGPYNILHPAPMYPPPVHGPMYGGGWAAEEVQVTRQEGEGFGFVVISSTNKATTTIGQLIPHSPAARCGLLQVGDTILAINGHPIRNLPHPEVVSLIKQSGRTVVLTIDRHNTE